ncbi:MAG: hypothetical protein WC437_05260 [Patescibacteria group bacterium]
MSGNNYNISKAVEAIDTFVNKVEELKRSNFAKWVKKRGLYKISFVNKSNKKGDSLIYPPKESIKSFVLTYRFFIQDNEKTSLRNINRIINNLPIDDLKKIKFSRSRDYFNNFLDSKYKFRIVGYGDITHREIQKVFIYGNLAHENVHYCEIYKKWTKDELVRDFMWINFCAVLHVVGQILSYMEGLCKDMRKDLY